MEGQKVVKVFCHEDACIQDFKGLNGKLRDSANNANRYASILMPVLGNLGYVSYAVIASGGGVPVHLWRTDDPWDAGILPAVFPFLQPADLTAFPAVKFHHHGGCRRRADIRAAG